MKNIEKYSTPFYSAIKKRMSKNNNSISDSTNNSLKILVDGGVSGGNSNAFDVHGLYYEDGTEITMSNSAKLIDAFNNGMNVFLCDDSTARRLGVVTRTEVGETSEGFRLCVWGILHGLGTANLHLVYYTVA